MTGAVDTLFGGTRVQVDCDQEEVMSRNLLINSGLVCALCFSLLAVNGRNRLRRRRKRIRR